MRRSRCVFLARAVLGLHRNPAESTQNTHQLLAWRPADAKEIDMKELTDMSVS